MQLRKWRISNVNRKQKKSEIEDLAKEEKALEGKGEVEVAEDEIVPVQLEDDASNTTWQLVQREDAVLERTEVVEEEIIPIQLVDTAVL